MNTNISAAESGNGNGDRRRRSVLVVDDQRVIADTLVAILNASACSARAAYSGEGALEAIAVNVPDLLITDVCMPGLNGIELAIQVRQQHPDCKVLLFSGHSASNHLIEEAHEKGYDFTLLHKPIHPRDLLQCLKTLA